MTLARALVTSLAAIALLATGSVTDAAVWRSPPPSPPPPVVSDDGSALAQFDAGTGVLGSGDAVDLVPAPVAPSTARRGLPGASLEPVAVGGEATYRASTVPTRFSPDAYAETGIAGSADRVALTFGYTAVMRFNAEGVLVSAAYTMTGPPPIDPAQVPLPSTLALLASALGVVVGVRAFRARTARTAVPG